MQVVDDTALKLLLPTATVEEISNRIGDSIPLNVLGMRQNILVKWEHSEAETLAVCLDRQRPDNHIEIPSPMLRDYDWPGIFTPFDHQKETASFLSIRPRSFCFNQAGTGKTSAAIWAADYLMKIGKVNKVLVICPLSIMYSAWHDDILKTAMHRTCGVAHGTTSKRAKILDYGYDFTIINYDGIAVVEKQIADKKFDLIIIDEANAYKTASTKRWKTLSRIILPTTRVWMMTGTPASQSPVDAFGLAKIISPERVPRYATAWRDAVMRQVSRFKWEPKHDAQTKVFNALQPAIRFTKEECLDLPPVMYQTRYIPLSYQADAYYRELKKEMLIQASGAQVSAVNAAAALNKLLQLSGGAVYTDDGEVLEFDISPRLNALKEVLDETSNKVIVFVPYHHTIQLLKEYLDNDKVVSEIISGDVGARSRSEIIKRFQTQTNPRVLIIQPQSASHGVTLTAADTIVFWSPVLSVETYLQCIGRIDRYGQKNKMTVVHLEGSKVERRAYMMLQNKVVSHNNLVDLYKQVIEEE